MKKIMAIMVAVLIAATSIACFVPAYAATNLFGANGDPDTATLGGNDPTADPCWNGWLDHVGNGNAEVKITRSIVETTLSDGTTGSAIEIKNTDNDDTYTAFYNRLGYITGLEPSTEYIYSVTMKYAGPYKDGRANSVWDAAMGLSVSNESGVIADKEGNELITFQESNDGKWATYTFDFVTSADSTTDSKYIFGVGIKLGGDGYALCGTSILIESASLVKAGEEDVPTGDTAIIAAIVLSVALLGAVVFTKKKVSA